MTPQILISMPKYSDQNEIMPIISSSLPLLSHPQSKNQNGTPEHDGNATYNINSTAYFWSNHLHQSWFLESIPQKRRPPKMSVISRRIYLSEFPNKIILLFDWWCGTKIDDEDGNINNHFIIMSPHSVTKLPNFV